MSEPPEPPPRSPYGEYPGPRPEHARRARRRQLFLGVALFATAIGGDLAMVLVEHHGLIPLNVLAAMGGVQVVRALRMPRG